MIATIGKNCLVSLTVGLLNSNKQITILLTIDFDGLTRLSSKGAKRQHMTVSLYLFRNQILPHS